MFYPAPALLLAVSVAVQLTHVAVTLTLHRRWARERLAREAQGIRIADLSRALGADRLHIAELVRRLRALAWGSKTQLAPAYHAPKATLTDITL